MTYDPEQLRFSAAARCRCGAGLAHPMNHDVRGAWECSAILLGDAQPSLDHDGPRPFMFWEVRSESGDDTANTTRPGGKIDSERLTSVHDERDLGIVGYPPELLANPIARRS